MAPAVVAAAIKKLEGIAGVKNPQWHWPLGDLPKPVKRWLEEKSDPTAKLTPYLEVQGSKGTPDPVNQFLQRREIPLRLEQELGLDGRPDPNSLYSASLFEALSRWIQPGKKTEIQLRDGSVVPAVSMVGQINSPQGIQIYYAKEGAPPVVRLETQDPNVSYLLTQPPQLENLKPGEIYRLIEQANTALQQQKISNLTDDYRGVVFPMVDYSLTEEKLAELIGADFSESQNNPVIISQAKAFLSLKMNETGTQAKAAAALGATRGFPLKKKPILVIDGPFVVGVIVNGEIAMVAPVKKQHMKDPGIIGDFGRGQQDYVSLYKRES